MVRASFRPEFLNRVDEIILFHRLQAREHGPHRRHPDEAAGEAARGSQDHASQLDAKAREWLAEKGYDPAYGARPLKRVIQKAVQDPLAELILSGKIKDGETVAISAGKQGLTFNGEVAQSGVTASFSSHPRTWSDKLGACDLWSRAEITSELSPP